MLEQATTAIAVCDAGFSWWLLVEEGSSRCVEDARSSAVQCSAMRSNVRGMCVCMCVDLLALLHAAAMRCAIQSAPK